MIGRLFVMLYSLACYVAAMAGILYAIGFIGDFVVPKTIDSGPVTDWNTVLAFNLPLLALFAVQHSGMARRGFKRLWTKFIPAPAERATYCLATAGVLALLFWQWKPMPGTVWQATDPNAITALTALYLAGWGLVFFSSFLINHFELFGLQQGFAHLRGKAFEPPGFYTPLLYKLVRHPLYVGLLIAFWATPHMTQGHLLFSIATTGYIVLGALLEERDLGHHFGAAYRDYRARVPMLVPFLKFGRR